MPLRWGFKTEAKNLGTEIRQELSLGPRDRLDPLALAQHLAIPVVPLSTYLDLAPAAAHLMHAEPTAFSAVTIFDGSRRMIIHNDVHSIGRQNSNLAHELAHGLLHHPPRPAVDHRGCRHWDQEIEDEANWLAGVLLVSEEAALAIARGRMTEETALEYYGVSNQMLTFRLNMTGARTRVRRWQQQTG